MKKEIQAQINQECDNAYVDAMAEYRNAFSLYGAEWVRLRSCSAHVAESRNFYYLRSYNTIVAIIDKRNDTCYDVLRTVYGYTATSAQHIAKFRHDYGSGKWGCTHEFMYRPI